MYKYLFLAVLPLVAQMPSVDFSDSGKKIAVQNGILAKVNKTTISVLDVRKKMDLFFHQHYSHLASSDAARCQFYEKSWRQMLMEMVDNELILADAVEKEVKVPDSEIRESMESRFGPNVLTTLDGIGLTYEEAWKLLRKEAIVQRMSWWFVQSKAIQSVTPQSIRTAYQGFLKENPPYRSLEYRIISIRGEDLETQAEKVYELLSQSGKSPEFVSENLAAIDPSIQVSSQYSASDLEISELHRSALLQLEEGQYGRPIIQKSRADNKEIARIFYLISNTDHPAPAFQDLSSTLRDELIQKAMAQHSQTYIQKLRKQHGFDAGFVNESLPEDLHPFSLQ